MNRREFLAGLAGAGVAGMAGKGLASACGAASGTMCGFAAAPIRRVRVGIIGLGMRGRGAWKTAKPLDVVNVDLAKLPGLSIESVRADKDALEVR